MKQALLLISFISITFLLQAQNIFIGLTAGLGHSWMNNIHHFSNSTWDRKFNATWNTGVSFLYITKKHFGLSADVKYSAEGDKSYSHGFNGGDVIESPGTSFFHADYIRVPVKFIYFFRKNTSTVRPEIYIGPSFGFSTNAKIVFKNDDRNYPISKYDISYDVKSFDLGSLIGTGLSLKLNNSIWMNTNIAYYQGLVDILKDHAANHIKEYNGNVSFNAALLYKLNY